jgi:hypothetical protein
MAMALASRPHFWHASGAILAAAAVASWLDASARHVESPWLIADEATASRALASVPWAAVPVDDLPVLHSESHPHWGSSSAQGVFGPVTLARSGHHGHGGSGHEESARASGSPPVRCLSGNPNAPVPGYTSAAHLVYRSRRAPPVMQFRCEVTEGPTLEEMRRGPLAESYRDSVRVLSLSADSFPLRAFVRAREMPDWFSDDDRAAITALRLAAGLLAATAFALAYAAARALARSAARRPVTSPPPYRATAPTAPAEVPAPRGWRAWLPRVAPAVAALAALLLTRGV